MVSAERLIYLIPQYLSNSVSDKKGQTMSLTQRIVKRVATGLVALVTACGPEMNVPSVDNGSRPSQDATDVYTPQPDAGFYDATLAPDTITPYDSGMSNPDARIDSGIYDAGMRDTSTVHPDARTNPDAMPNPIDAGRINQAPIVYAGPSMELELDVDYCFNFARNPTMMPQSCQGPNARWAPGHSPAGTGSYDPDGTIVRYTVRLDKNNPMAPTRHNAMGVFVWGYWGPVESIMEVGAEDNEGATGYSETTVNVR
ncbi:MAG: hypothetical protein WC595_05890 [Candidatus Nanoarchaeia archaeon]